MASVLRGVYITGKLSEDELVVRDLLLRLATLGYHPTYDWTANIVTKPFRDHQEQARTAADEMINAVIKAELVIVLMNSALKGGLIELGANLGAVVMADLLGHRKRIIVVGDEASREITVFTWHSAITHCLTIEEALTIAAEKRTPAPTKGTKGFDW